ncbi:MAG TPA: ABC transporter permease, partial [Acidobacteriaceae bacterium]|nr:ABC transporter permease [Acidobacteriaceae bacterium]
GTSPRHLTLTLSLYLREIRYEFLRALRNKGFSLAIIGFPTMFYLLFGVANRGDTLGPAHLNFAKYLLAGYSGFGTVGAALFGIGVGLAFERTSGWLDLKRASPMPPLAYLIARCAMAVLFSLLIVTVLFALGVAAAGVHLTPLEYLRLLATAVVGSAPFAALGLMLAMLLPPNSAPGIVNMIYLPMSYASGLWIPVPMLPKFVQGIAPWLPTYHLAQLMVHAVGYGAKGDLVSSHILALAGFTCIFLGAAWIAFSRIEEA